METETLDLNGHEFFVRRWGARDLPPLVLLHGFPEYSGAFDALARRLEHRFHCIAPDQRGYGQSWKPEGVGNYRMSLLVGDALALIERVAPGKPVFLLGHDWGAAVAYALAVGAPARVAKLVILNGVHPIPFQDGLASGGPQSEASQYINWLLREDSAERLAANDFEKLVHLMDQEMGHPFLTSEMVAAYRTEWRRPGALTAMINWYRASPFTVAAPGKPLPPDRIYPLDPAKMRISMPHLIVWGQDDTALLPATRDAVKPLCDDVRIVPIEGVDHWLHHQVPDRVATEILGFL